MRELTELDKAVLKSLTTHRFPDEKKPNVMMLVTLLIEKAAKYLGEELAPEERDFYLSLLCDIMETILNMRIINDGQTK